MPQNEFVDFEIETDFGAIKPMTGDFQLVDEGTYKVEVTHLEQNTANNEKQTPMVVATLTITEDQDSEEAQRFAGQNLWCNYPLTQKALGRLSNLMLACEVPMDKFRASALIGCKLIVDVVHNQGKETTDQEGNVRPARTFANVVRERSLTAASGAAAEEVPPTPAPAPAKPKASKPAAAAPAATVPPAAAKPAATKNGAAAPRRA